jgi:hypothetical protein
MLLQLVSPKDMRNNGDRSLTRRTRNILLLQAGIVNIHPLATLLALAAALVVVVAVVVVVRLEAAEEPLANPVVLPTCRRTVMWARAQLRLPMGEWPP